MNEKRSERPILFNDWSVRAILEERKTQTRRPVKEQPPEWVTGHDGVWPWVHFTGRDPWHGGPVMWTAKCPYGVPGDRLWVREAWATLKQYDDLKPSAIPIYDSPPKLWHKADTGASNHSPNRGRWRPSIFMPRWASRLTLEIVSVRVERVQEISVRDCYAEGATKMSDPTPEYPEGTKIRQASIMRIFSEIWDAMYAKTDYAWERNPWVWAVEFRRIDEQQR